MKINTIKFKVITLQDQNVSFGGEPIKNVNKFIFLGNLRPGSKLDIDCRIGLACCAFAGLKRTICSNTKISTKV